MNSYMENEKIKDGIKEIKNIKMTSAEKSHMLENILNSPIIKTEPIKSPYSFFSLFPKNSLFYYSVVLALIVVIISKKDIILTYFQNENIQNTKIAQNTEPKKEMPSSEKKVAINKTDELKNNIEVIKPAIQYPTNSNQGVNGVPMGMTANSDATPQKYTDTASTLFTKWLLESKQNDSDLLDHRIDKIDFISFKKEISNDAFTVKITYSEKTNNGWGSNKYLFVTIDKDSGKYFIKNTNTTN